MPNTADSICSTVGEIRSWGEPLYTLSFYLVEQNRPGSHLLIHWRTHAHGFAQKPNPVSIQWLGQPNRMHILLQYWNIPCPNTLVGSVSYFFILLKYSLFYYNNELYPSFLHCWSIPNLNIWGIAYLSTLLSNSQKPIQCWARIPILTHC